MTSHRSSNSKFPNINGWKQARPRHSLGYNVRHALRTTIICVVCAAFAFVGTAAAAAYIDLNSTVVNNTVKVISQSTATPTVIDPNAGQPIQFALLGQDTREGDSNASLGGDDGTSTENHMADTTMVVQISADRSWVNIVSIPRDSIVSVPSCQTTNGTIPAQYNIMFNSIFSTAYQQGGDLSSAASCTMAAINALTGLDLQQFIVVDFQGLRDMIDAIGGVDLCIATDTTDSYTGLSLSHGLQHLDGTQATQYARMRHGTGTDGSDIMRTTRQQYLIKELFKQAMQKNLFTQVDQLYQLAKSALNSLNISTGLADTATLAGLAMSMKDMDTSHIYARTIPVTAAPYDQNRVVWSSDADAVWAKLRENQPLTESTEESADTSSESTDANSADASTESSESSASTDTSTEADTTSSDDASTSSIDPTTGLIIDAQGNLIDPATGGIVNPDDGIIRDAVTGQYIGIADRYLNATVCAVPAQD